MLKRLLTVCLLSVSMLAGGVEYKDTLRVLCVGNSFTYVDSAQAKLRSLASSQGHYLDINAQLQGGYTFQRHLRRDATLSAIVYYTYDYAFLQDQSRTPALVGQDSHRGRWAVSDGRELAERIRMYSPRVKIVMEQTWSYRQGDYGGFGSWDRFDELLRKGSKRMAKAMKAELSPIGEAFALCRERYPEIMLYDKDEKHQSAYGSYLKACVNYLLIYKVPFTDGADDCGLDPEKTAKLREIASQVVL